MFFESLHQLSTACQVFKGLPRIIVFTIALPTNQIQCSATMNLLRNNLLCFVLLILILHPILIPTPIAILMWILFFQTFFIIWILNVCIGFTHNNDTEKNKINKFFQELYQDC